MIKTMSFRPWNLEQTLLLPPSPVAWLLENHIVPSLSDLAAEPDLKAIHVVSRRKDPRDEKAYDPQMMVQFLSSYCAGLPRSRRIGKACLEDAAFRVFTGSHQPETPGP